MHYVRRLQVALTGSPYLDFKGTSNHFVSTIIINIHIMYRTPISQRSPTQLMVYEERFNPQERKITNDIALPAKIEKRLRHLLNFLMRKRLQ